MLERISDSKRVSESLLHQLEEDGIVIVPDLISASQLAGMQRAFASRLKRLRWNDFDGYEQTELYRHMVQDVLTLDQGFVDAALHPVIRQVLDGYLGTGYELTEAKGWKSLPTKRDFHGWHGDAWYDQEGAAEIYREVKLAIYLSDVRSGAFNYIRGSHRKQHPRMVRNSELKNASDTEVVQLSGRAGTAFLFDTSGIHRQGVPVLEPRMAIFYNYHDPTVPLQKEDVEYYRYHPLLLNAAFLTDLTADSQRILGFGRKTNYHPAFFKPEKHGLLQRFSRLLLVGKLHVLDLPERIKAPLRWALGR